MRRCSTVADKADFTRATGACAVDMESHIAARLRGAAWPAVCGAVRVVCDPADRAVAPRFAMRAVRADGTTERTARS